MFIYNCAKVQKIYFRNTENHSFILSFEWQIPISLYNSTHIWKQ